MLKGHHTQGETTLMDLVKSGKLADYDLKNEKSDYQNYSGIERWLYYQQCSDGFDSDVCQLAIEVQAKLLEDLYHQGTITLQPGSKLKYEFQLATMTLRGDTMTSGWTLVKKYQEIILNDSSNPKADKITQNPELVRFIQLQNTVGNQLLVPAAGKAGFNTNRAGFGKTDQTDIMLFAIYNDYTNRDAVTSTDSSIKSVTLKRLLNNDDAVKIAREWLALFESWEEFVDRNALLPFLDAQTGQPKLLWKTHQFGHLPTTSNEFEELFKSSNRWIYNRGLAIQQRLRNA